MLQSCALSGHGVLSIDTSGLEQAEDKTAGFISAIMQVPMDSDPLYFPPRQFKTKFKDLCQDEVDQSDPARNMKKSTKHGKSIDS